MFLRRGEDAEEDCVKTEADRSYTSRNQGMPRIVGNHQKLRRGKEGFYSVSEGVWQPRPHLDFGLLASGMVSQYISVALRRYFGGTLLWQPRETNMAGKGKREQTSQTHAIAR